MFLKAKNEDSGQTGSISRHERTCQLVPYAGRRLSIYENDCFRTLKNFDLHP